ncbi:MAG: hypothetical protein CMJ48_11135 [Planctomycetaceae bacterium]|nr:hypothetical protein [Planctomycetaceae bacterium]
MARSIIIRNGVHWTATDWIVQNVTATIEEHLVLGDAEKAVSRRLQPVYRDLQAVADFSEADVDELQVLWRAARSEYNHASRMNADEWYEPESLPEYLSAFAQLVELLRADDRLKPDRPQGGPGS